MIPVLKDVVKRNDSDVKFVTELSIREKLVVLKQLVDKYQRVEHMEMLLEAIKLAKKIR